MASTFAYYDRVLRFLHSRRPPYRWLVKSPLYLFHLMPMAEQFPNARFVFTHRDPALALPSTCSTVLDAWSLVVPSVTVDRPDVGRFVLEHYVVGMQRALAARDELGEHRFLDVGQHEVQHDPIGTAERIYAFLDLELTRRRPRRDDDLRGREPTRRTRRAHLHGRGVRLHRPTASETRSASTSTDSARSRRETDDDGSHRRDGRSPRTRSPPRCRRRPSTARERRCGSGTTPDRVGLPRIAVEALGATWDTARNASVNVALPDGRVLLVREDAAPHPVSDAQGRPRVLGTGPLRFECIEPFDRWRLTFDGTANTTTVQDQIARCTEGASDHVETERVPLRMEIETRMAAPPWIQGSLDPDGHFVVGERRFEQLFTAEGAVEIDGNSIVVPRRRPAHPPQGRRPQRLLRLVRALLAVGGVPERARLRVHPLHAAARRLGEVPRGLGARRRRGPRRQGRRHAVETRAGTQTAKTSPSRSARPRGDVAITAETQLSTFSPTIPMGGDVAFPPVQQGIARYRWDGEEAYGMIERSIRADLPAGYSTQQ